MITIKQKNPEEKQIGLGEIPTGSWFTNPRVTTLFRRVVGAGIEIYNEDASDVDTIHDWSHFRVCYGDKFQIVHVDITLEVRPCR